MRGNCGMARNVNSKAKGNAGERNSARKLRDLGFTDAHRDGQQGAGARDHPDMVGPPGYRVEVKRQERFGGYEIYQALFSGRQGQEARRKVSCIASKE